MSVKKFTTEVFDDTIGPMNSVSKDDAKVWARKKARSEKLAPEQVHRIEVAKKKKAVTSSKKQDRKQSKDIIKHLGKDSL